MTPVRERPVALEQSSAVGPQLYRLLRDRIVKGALAPGTRISESEIAASYKVSRQPVREAFIKLAEEALVEVRPQRGTYVRRISVPAVMTARFVREAVEADIVRQAARAVTPEILALLEANLAAQRAVVDSDDPSRFMELDEGFHRLLAEAAGQPAIWDILEDLKTQMDRVRHISTRQFPRERLIDQHAAVVAALRAGDPQAAETELRTHLKGVLTDLPAIAEAMSEFFDEAGG